MRSKQRVRDYGEVFTPPSLVNDMLNLVKDEVKRLDARVIDPACGNGNFLVEVLSRKLAELDKDDYRSGILAVSSIYGIDILLDNVNECRHRLYSLVKDKFPNGEDRFYFSVEYLLSRNIVHGNSLLFETLDSSPIVFSEWNFDGDLVYRKDYVYRGTRVKKKHLEYLDGDIVPVLIKSFPPVFFMDLGESYGDPSGVTGVTKYVV